MRDKGDSAPDNLTPGARRLFEEVTATAGPQATAPCIVDWLRVLMQRHAPMMQAMIPGLALRGLWQRVSDPSSQEPWRASLPPDTVLAEALAMARDRGAPLVAERDIVATVLRAAQLGEIDPTGRAVWSEERLDKRSGKKTGAEARETHRPIAGRPTPVLEQFGRELVQEARDGLLHPIVGRDREIQMVIETLCRTTKRNPVLIGPAGAGKTAIVEGLAQRIHRGEVPDFLKGARLFALQPSTLVAGAGHVGELEERTQGILKEAAQPSVILFIDEFHSVVGAGGMPGTSDLASHIKPALARGDIACIAATTDDEYRRFVEGDQALERRFTPVPVGEMTREQAHEVLLSVRDHMVEARGVPVSDATIARLVEIADESMRNRRFPDKGIDLLDRCLARAMASGLPAVDGNLVEEVARDLIGMPASAEDRLAALGERLGREALLESGDEQLILDRLAVTLSGHDIRSQRPNGVFLLAGEAAAAATAVGRAMAEALFGAEERLIRIDFGRFLHAADITMLIGAPPGYVGFAEALPLQPLAQFPGSVVLVENVDGGHPAIRDVLAQAIADGSLTDARGRKTWLSDAVVLLTCASPAGTTARIGFSVDHRAPEADMASLVNALGPKLREQCDVVVVRSPGLRRPGDWLEHGLLPALARRYRKHGLNLTWDASFLSWLTDWREELASAMEWERFVEGKLEPALRPALSGRTDPAPGAAGARPEAGERHAGAASAKETEGERISAEENVPRKILVRVENGIVRAEQVS